MTVLSLLLAAVFTAAPAIAQRVTVETQGNDKKDRAPYLTVSWGVDDSIDGSPITVLASSDIHNKDYSDKPIAYEFYVNGQLFTKQIWSPELPRPIGIILGKEHVPPFSVTVRANLIDANREFNTVAQIAIFSRQFQGAFDCTLSIDSEDGVTSSSFTANEVGTSQSSNDNFGVSFTGTAVEGTETATVQGTFTSGSEGTITGEIVVTTGEATTTYAVSGEVAGEGDAMTSFDVSSENGLVGLVCS